MKGLEGHCMDFGFDSKRKWEAIEGFEQRGDMTFYFKRSPWLLF